MFHILTFRVWKLSTFHVYLPPACSLSPCLHLTFCQSFKVVQLDHTCLQVPWRLSATELNSLSLTSLKRICGVWYLDIKEIRFSKELPEGYKEISQTSKEVEICKEMQDTTKICHSVKLKCKKLESLSRWSSSFDYFDLTDAMIKSQSICKHRVVTALNSRAV